MCVPVGVYCGCGPGDGFPSLLNVKGCTMGGRSSILHRHDPIGIGRRADETGTRQVGVVHTRDAGLCRVCQCLFVCAKLSLAVELLGSWKGGLIGAR